MAKTFQFDDFTSPQHLNCGACEELLADAIDGVLSPADKGFFDHHLAACAGCSERFTAAQRGVAWLDLLKTHRPEPPVELIGRIIAADLRTIRRRGIDPFGGGCVSGRCTVYG